MRVIGLALIVVSVIHADHRPGGHGRGLVITVLAGRRRVLLVVVDHPADAASVITPDLWVMAGAGGLLCAASPDSAASAFVFVAVVSAGVRVELAQAVWVAVAGTVALAIGDIIYGNVGVGLLAYTLGFAASVLAASTSRQSAERVEQAELLLAQTQRSHEEQLRAARLEESTRIAREIHDVLAHALAGLTIQLEATTSLIERGADRAEVLARVQRAHELARDGLRETRLAVGALRGDPVSAPSGIEALVTDYRAGADAEARAHHRRRRRSPGRPHRTGGSPRRPGGAHQRPQARPGRGGIRRRPRRRAARRRGRRSWSRTAPPRPRWRGSRRRSPPPGVVTDWWACASGREGSAAR